MVSTYRRREKCAKHYYWSRTSFFTYCESSRCCAPASDPPFGTMKEDMQTTLGIFAFSSGVKVARASKPGIPPYECRTGTTVVAPWATAWLIDPLMAAMSALKTLGGGEALAEGNFGAEVEWPDDSRRLTREVQWSGWCQAPWTRMKWEFVVIVMSNG